MEYKALGKSGLMVSLVCIGTMTFGQQIDESESVRLIKMAFDQGVNFIDTANVYTKGFSEVIVGKALEGVRERIILATKAGETMGTGPLDRGLSRSSVMRELDRSLKRLNTDYIDIYYMHMPDYVTDIE